MGLSEFKATGGNKALYTYLTSDYDLRYKSIATSSSDKVKVTNFNRKDSIIFKDKYGVRLKLSDNNILNFSSQSTADTNYIYAYKGDKKVGFYFKKSKEYMKSSSLSRTPKAMIVS